MDLKKNSFSDELLPSVFPFHIVMDDNLRITGFGKALTKIDIGMQKGTFIQDIFSIETPKIETCYQTIIDHSGTVFFLKDHTRKLVLKGEMLEVVNNVRNRLIFLCSPVIKKMEEIGDLGIALDDFPKHDSTIDFLILLQTQSNVLKDLRKMANTLREEIKVRRTVQEELKDANDLLEGKVAERTNQLNITIDKLNDEISARKQVELQLKANLDEKEIILKEVHHRIRNNMSMIKGLLKLQSGAIENNPEAINALIEAENRVQSMLVLYDKLFLSTDYNNVSTKKYFENLIDEIIHNFPNKNIISIISEIEDVMLSAKNIFDLGIIINELITNTMKYAFVSRESGKIKISLSTGKEQAILMIQNDGIPLPESVSFENPAGGFGFKLVALLVNQLNGNIQIERGEGTKFIIKFNIET